VGCQLQAPDTLPAGMSHWYPMDRSTGEPQSRSRCGNEKKIPAPAGGLTSTIQLITTELPWLIKRQERAPAELGTALANPPFTIHAVGVANFCVPKDLPCRL